LIRERIEQSENREPLQKVPSPSSGERDRVRGK